MIFFFSFEIKIIFVNSRFNGKNVINEKVRITERRMDNGKVKLFTINSYTTSPSAIGNTKIKWPSVWSRVTREPKCFNRT